VWPWEKGVAASRARRTGMRRIIVRARAYCLMPNVVYARPERAEASCGTSRSRGLGWDAAISSVLVRWGRGTATARRAAFVGSALWQKAYACVRRSRSMVAAATRGRRRAMSIAPCVRARRMSIGRGYSKLARRFTGSSERMREFATETRRSAPSIARRARSAPRRSRPAWMVVKRGTPAAGRRQRGLACCWMYCLITDRGARPTLATNCFDSREPVADTWPAAPGILCAAGDSSRF